MNNFNKLNSFLLLLLVINVFVALFWCLLVFGSHYTFMSGGRDGIYFPGISIFFILILSTPHIAYAITTKSISLRKKVSRTGFWLLLITEALLIAFIPLSGLSEGVIIGNHAYAYSTSREVWLFMITAILPSVYVFSSTMVKIQAYNKSIRNQTYYTTFSGSK